MYKNIVFFLTVSLLECWYSETIYTLANTNIQKQNPKTNVELLTIFFFFSIVNTILHFLINIKGLHLWQWWRRTIRFRWIEINRIVYTNRNTSIKSCWSPYRARCLGHRHLHGHYGQTGSSRLGKRKRYVENWKIEKLKNWKCSKIVFTILEL